MKFLPHLTALLLTLAISAPTARADDKQDLLRDATAAFERGHKEEAIKLADQAIAAAPTDPLAYLMRGAFRDDPETLPAAIADYDKAIELDPKLARAYEQRGVARFMSGQIKPSIADFDRYIELVPDAKPHHWQRGIALYYAGQYEEGAKQFELHRTVNPDDVENAAWHFLCVARWKDVAAARAVLIPIAGDARVPMMKVHELFAGKATIDDVMTEAKAGQPGKAQLDRHLFYAHLYVGLYCEATGKPADAKTHLTEALKHPVPDYMYGVAKVHVNMLK